MYGAFNARDIDGCSRLLDTPVVSDRSDGEAIAVEVDQVREASMARCSAKDTSFTSTRSAMI
jgi:hypothetical protein